MDTSDDSIDTVYLGERIADYRSSGHPTWTSYLNTLSTRLRRFYLDQPPNQADFKPTAISALHVPDYDNSGTQAPYYEPKDPALPHSADQEPTRLGGYPATTRHISDVTHQQRGRPILSNPNRPQHDNPASPKTHQDPLPHSSHANGQHPPQSSKLPLGSDTVPSGTARLRDILTTLRKTQNSTPPNPPNTSRPGGYHTGNDSAHSSDSDNDPNPPGLPEAAHIQTWITSQLPWSQYRQRLPTHQRLAYGNRSPPHVVRQAPNQQHIWANHNDSIDRFRPAQRMAAFHASNSPTWSEYLKTLPPHTRRAYLDHPPMSDDYRPTPARIPHESTHPNNDLKDPARPHPADAEDPHQPPNDHTSRLEGYTSHLRHANDPPPHTRLQPPHSTTSSNYTQTPPNRVGSHLTPKIARATAPKPNGDPSDVPEEMPARPIGPHYNMDNTTGPTPRERTRAILHELRRNPLDPRTRGIPSHNKLIPDVLLG